MSLNGGFGSIIFHMVIDMDETRLQTISQLSAFLAGTLEVHFAVPDSDDRRYAHIVSDAQRFGYQHSGFSVDAGVCIEAHDRAALERLLRYRARAVCHGSAAQRRCCHGVPQCEATQRAQQ